jgi:hypothetical protein
MAIRPEDLDFISNFDTAWAVILGAVLATLGGVVATHMERVSGRRERERNAALLFGEVLATLDLLLGIAERSRGRGDPYGTFTMRILRSARRELDVYERNRERLFELEDGALRARIHTLMVRLALPLDNLFDATREISELERESGDAAPGEVQAALTTLKERRDGEFDFLTESAKLLTGVTARLEPIARQSFQGLSEVARNTGAPVAAPQDG